jgi:hypothetical protein
MRKTSVHTTSTTTTTTTTTTALRAACCVQHAAGCHEYSPRETGG